MSDRVGNTMKCVFPDELTAGSVVLDRDGHAWQRVISFPTLNDARWHQVVTVNPAYTSLSWIQLLAAHGPLLCIHDAKTEPAQVTP